MISFALLYIVSLLLTLLLLVGVNYKFVYKVHGKVELGLFDFVLCMIVVLMPYLNTVVAFVLLIIFIGDFFIFRQKK